MMNRFLQYIPTRAKGYVARNGTNIDDVMLNIHHTFISACARHQTSAPSQVG